MALLGRCCALLLAAAAASSAPAASAGTAHDEYALKAAFLLNFARLVEWPEAAGPAPGEPLVLCVLADERVGTAIERGANGKSVGSRPLRVLRLSRAEEGAGCHLVFLEAGAGGPAAFQRRGLLTVGERDGFARAGGVINFYRAERKLRFEVNPQAAARAGLKISSRLLRVARIVGGEGE